VRIHIDTVDRLGTFIEFEAMVTRSFTVRDGHDAIAELRDIFGQMLGEPISVSYSDLMEQELAESV
jgi:adenylate cyclase class IV